LRHGRELTSLAAVVELIKGKLDILDDLGALETEANLNILTDFDFIERLDFDTARSIFHPGSSHIGILQINRLN
jgi:hypothetical protein